MTTSVMTKDEIARYLIVAQYILRFQKVNTLAFLEQELAKHFKLTSIEVRAAVDVMHQAGFIKLLPILDEDGYQLTEDSIAFIHFNTNLTRDTMAANEAIAVQTAPLRNTIPGFVAEPGDSQQ